MAGMLTGKVALVTGAGTGIGRATALLLAREGASVVLGDIREDAGSETVAQVTEAGGTAAFVAMDVSDEEQVEALVARALDRFGALDCAVNNAGVSGPLGPLHDLERTAWERTLSINLGGVFLCMKHELRAMQPRGGGSIVNVASGAGIVATPGMAAYCASKHAILGLTKTAAVENAGTGVRINAVCPGSTDTPMLRATMEIDPVVEKMIRASLPGGRLGEPDEIAEAIVWLCSGRASFVSGESMLVDGGAVAR